jgi:hypothetical protein
LQLELGHDKPIPDVAEGDAFVVGQVPLDVSDIIAKFSTSG